MVSPARLLSQIFESVAWLVSYSLYSHCGVGIFKNGVVLVSCTSSGPENVSTLRMTNCPDFKFWPILLIVFANTALILKVYVCGVRVV